MNHTPVQTLGQNLFWVNAGELSGDMQGAALLAALRAQNPTLEAVGMGGPLLAAAGQQNLLRVEDLSVMGIAEVLSALPRALRMLARIRTHLACLRPKVVILVDAPEFNFRVARIAHSLGIPVVYFIPPKVWAWRTRRVRFLRTYIRKLYCILPFEPDFYAKHHLTVEYVGNPLVDMVDYPSIASIEALPHRVGLMPGSRKKEISALLPLFGQTAKNLLAQYPHLHFHCLRAPNMDEDYLRALWPSDVPIVFEKPDNRYAFMRTCRCLLAASGTATLETALAGVPTVVAYKVAPFSALCARFLLKTPFVSLPNLIINREVFPELLQDRATPELMTRHLSILLTDNAAHAAVCAQLDCVRQLCGEPGSAQRAAQTLLRDVKQF